MTCGLPRLHIACTFKFPHIVGELSISLSNCITSLSPKKAQWNKGWVLGPGCSPHLCPILILAGGHQEASADPPELTSTLGSWGQDFPG